MHYLCKISSVTVLSHRRGTIHSIFKIGISRNMKCAYMVGFLKYSHIFPKKGLQWEVHGMEPMMMPDLIKASTAYGS